MQFDRLPQAPSTANPPASDPAYVAASIAKTALEFRRLIANGVLEPELAGKTKEDGELCMESYKWSVSLTDSRILRNAQASFATS